MNNHQILWLAGQARQGLAYWRDGEGRMQKITRVETSPVDLDDDGVAVPAAIFQDGQWVDLHNAEPADFHACQPMF